MKTSMKENTPCQELNCQKKIMTNSKLRCNQDTPVACLSDCFKEWNKCIQITNLILDINLTNSIKT